MENQKKTLEQTIAEGFKSGSTGLFYLSDQSVSQIATAVRDWMREQNNDLHTPIEQILHNAGIGDSGAVTDAILSVIPPREDVPRYVSGSQAYAERTQEDEFAPISPAEADDIHAILKDVDLHIQRGLTKEEHRELSQFLREQGEPMNPPQAEDSHELDCNCVECVPPLDSGEPMIPADDSITPEQAEKFLKDLDEARARDRAFQAEQAAYRKGEIVSPNDLATVQKQLEQERERTKWLMKNRDEIFSNANKRITELERELDLAHAKLAEANALVAPGVTHTDTAKEVWESVLGKAGLYDELREKFPFLPGEHFYAIRDDRIRRFECVEIEGRGAYLIGEARGAVVRFKPDQCFATPQELTSKLEVVE